MGLNLEILKAITQYAGKNALLDWTMVILANSYAVLAPLYLLYLWFKGKEEKKAALLITTGIALSLVVSFSISSIYYHPRPFAAGVANALFHHSADSSFPSDGATTVFALAFMVLFLRWYRSGSILLLYAILVGIARIFCGVHWPLDILGGATVGLVGSYITFAFRRRLNRFYDRIIDWYSSLINSIKPR